MVLEPAEEPHLSSVPFKQKRFEHTPGLIEESSPAPDFSTKRKSTGSLTVTSIDLIASSFDITTSALQHLLIVLRTARIVRL